jgi:hypothetical protein
VWPWYGLTIVDSRVSDTYSPILFVGCRSGTSSQPARLLADVPLVLGLLLRAVQVYKKLMPILARFATSVQLLGIRRGKQSPFNASK